MSQSWLIASPQSNPSVSPCMQGYCASSLSLGCDCLGAIKYFDATWVNAMGQPVELRKVSEEQNSDGWSLGCNMCKCSMYECNMCECNMCECSGLGLLLYEMRASWCPGSTAAALRRFLTKQKLATSIKYPIVRYPTYLNPTPAINLTLSPGRKRAQLTLHYSTSPPPEALNPLLWTPFRCLEACP
jgi:hypothetical protein